MLRDVFYFGSKPNVHPRERPANDLAHAMSLATTEHFWIVNEFCDYTGFDWDFDFDFLPDEDVWAQDHNNVWPSVYQKDSGTWLCNSSEDSALIIYRNDVAPLQRKKVKDNWVITRYIDENVFNFDWHPDPTDPPYIYQFGTQWQKTGGPRYVVPGATEVKYVDSVKARALVDKRNWIVPENLDTDDFDFSWHPDDTEPAYIYQFGTQWSKQGGPLYIVDGATEIKYISYLKALALPDLTKWYIPENIDLASFDFSWQPDVDDQPYIYEFGTQWHDRGGPVYLIAGATEYKYLDRPRAKTKASTANWHIPENVNVDSFDFSWVPHPDDPAYIYQFGTQWQKTGGPRYVVDGATEVKYIDIKATATATNENWHIISNDQIKSVSFDFSWHPDDTEEPYIYVFGNQYYSAEVMPTVEYRVPGATQIKYINTITATIINDNNNRWIIPNNIAVGEGEFDFNWIPDPNEPAYIYEWNTQWQKNGGIQYTVPGATEIKYLTSDKIRALPTNTAWSVNNWQILPGFKIKETGFDFSWHPDNTEPAYIYVFGNNLYPAEECATVQYTVPGATEIKYVHDEVAVLDDDYSNWTIPTDIELDNFDFSWIPKPNDPAYIYEFSTQWQKTGGPRYVVPEATEVKYIATNNVKHLPTEDNWNILDGFSIKEFDFSWHPDATEPAYIYVFGNQWNPAEIEPTIEYHVPGATERKYINDIKAELAPDKTNWTILHAIDENAFDFSWRPDPNDPAYIYVFGNQYYPAERMPTLLYKKHDHAVENKYINDLVPVLVPDMSKWRELIPIDKRKFNFNWIPDPGDPPYIYVFGNQWFSAEEEPTLEYQVSGATVKKYVPKITAYVLPDMSKWTIPTGIDVSDFDFTWRPDPGSPPYVYQFGTIADDNDGPVYTSRDTNGIVVNLNRVYKPEEEIPLIEVKQYYIETDLETLVAQHPDEIFWAMRNNVDYTNFDFDWRPEIITVAWESDYVHVFGTPEAEIIQTYFVNAKSYLKGKKDFKYHEADKTADLPTQFKKIHGWLGLENSKIDALVNNAYAKNLPQYSIKTTLADLIREHHDEVFWAVRDNVDYKNFNFDWRPDITQVYYIQVFGPRDAEIAQTYFISTEFYSLGYHDLNYVEADKAADLPTQFKKIHGWLGLDNSKIDSIVTQLYGSNLTQYSIKTTLADLIQQHPGETFWAIRDNIDYSKFNFEWKPSVELATYVQVFGSPDSELTQTYLVSADLYNQGYNNFNFVEADKKLNDEYLTTLFKPNDMFFVDRGNAESRARFEKLKTRFPNIQKTRFLNTWVDTINRCINRSNTELCWILNSEYDYNNFNFNYYPNPWQMKMVHVFGTQWNHWGHTYVVNRDTFAEDTRYIKIIEHLSNLNFVKDRKAICTNNLYDIWLVDHGNDLTDVKKQLESRCSGKTINIIAYDTNYITTFRNLVNKIPAKKEDYIWLCSSVCDYSGFDFTYTVDPFSLDNLHVFPSDRQKFGDTFFVDVTKTREVIESMDQLQAYPKINYNSRLQAKRLAAPVINIDKDTFAGAIDVDFNFPYAVFQTESLDVADQEPMSLWSDDMKNIVVTSTGATRIVVPREAKSIVKNELYDYPYIKTASKLGSSKPMDIVFLSNGEQCADENYRHLLAATKHTKNRVVRVDGIDGRVAAYHAAVEASNTPWAFTVFAKLKVNSKFDWGWQPDRLQIPKHYIFHARNPVNGLEYGHQGMIAYNKKLTLANQGKGLDFTLDDPHETVKLLSGTATFNTDPYATWRTAFREAIKLQSDYGEIAAQRLKVWTEVATGDFADDCLRGARDAVEFYDSVMGDMDELKKSYEWSWLKEFYRKKYR